MRPPPWLLIALVALAGCEARERTAGAPAPKSASADPPAAPAKATPAPDAAAATPPSQPPPDAEEPDPDLPLRAGKRTGLVAGETPEVATEELMRALVDGTVDVAGLVDPAIGVLYQDEDMTRPKRHCGAAAVEAVKKHLVLLGKMLATRIGDPGDEYLLHTLECSNEFLVQEDPEHHARYASCGTGDTVGAEDVPSIDFYLVPDAGRGLRIAGLGHTLTGLVRHPLDGLGPKLAATDACK
jgi:hypothetical protein